MRRAAIMAVLAIAATAGAAGIDFLQSAFTGGELSPLAEARLDADRYYRSAATLENLLAVPQGPLVRRPGTRFVAATDANHAARLIAFRYSSDDADVLELTDSLMRVYCSHALVEDANGDPYELATPFDANEIADLQWWQNADTCYLVDGTDWPQKLVRTDHNDWTIADANIQDGPFLTENATSTTLAADATTGDVNLVASGAVFDGNQVDGYWRLRHFKGVTAAGPNTLADINDATASLGAQNGVSFEWSVNLAGYGTHTVELQCSFDDGATWSTYTSYTGTVYNSYAATTPEVFDNDSGRDMLIRAQWTASPVPGSIVVVAKVWTHAYTHTGVVQLTGVTDACNATATVIRDLASTDATVQWSEGAWSDYRGFPRAIAGYSDRLVLAGTAWQPLTLWFSRTGEHERFDTGEGLDADGFGYGINRAEQDPIVWVTAQRGKGLVVGTTGSVLELQPMDGSRAITPSNFPTPTSVLAVPCANTAPVLADNILLVLQRHGRKVREVFYSYDADSLVGPDLTLFSEHVTAGGLTALAWVGQPYTALWAARSDGQLVSVAYDRNYQVVAPSRHVLGGGGLVESLAAVPGASEDELWFAVRRTIDGNTVRYVEYLAPWDWGDDVNDCYFVDCGLSYDANATTDFNGLGHLEGAAVSVFADAAAGKDTTVSDGAVSLERAASVVHVGLAYTSTLTTVRYDFAGPDGTTWGRHKGITRAVVSWYQTLGARVGPDASHLLQPLYAVPGAVVSGGAPALYTGDTEQALPAAWGADRSRLWIVQDRPYPMTIRAVTATVEVR